MKQFFECLGELYTLKGIPLGKSMSKYWHDAFNDIPENRLIIALKPFFESGRIPTIEEIKRALGLYQGDLTPQQKATELVERMIKWVCAGHHVLPAECLPWEATIIDSLGGLTRFRDRVNTGEYEDVQWGKREWAVRIALRIENPNAVIDAGGLNVDYLTELGLESFGKKPLRLL